jgi:hypothetical protein
MMQHMHLVHLRDHMSETEIDHLRKCANEMEWYRKVPGGFTTTAPPRFVNSFGNGSGYSNTQDTIGKSWSEGHWTAAKNQNDLTLTTPTAPLPEWLQKLGVLARQLASSFYNIESSTHMFNLAVCNKYEFGSDKISAHTDDNEWYTRDLACGPMFASLTLYNDTKPTSSSEHARFQICIEGKWQDYVLPDATLLFMPACIPHRVQPHKPNTRHHKRINITLRSVPSVESDPVSSIRGVSNHARYYRLPSTLTVPANKETNPRAMELLQIFNKCLDSHNHKQLAVIIDSNSKLQRATTRTQLMSTIQKRDKTIAPRTNITLKALRAVCDVL